MERIFLSKLKTKCHEVQIIKRKGHFGKLEVNIFINKERTENLNLYLYVMHFIIREEVSIGFQNKEKVNVTFVYLKRG